MNTVDERRVLDIERKIEATRFANLNAALDNARTILASRTSLLQQQKLAPRITGIVSLIGETRPMLITLPVGAVIAYRERKLGAQYCLTGKLGQDYEKWLIGVSQYLDKIITDISAKRVDQIEDDLHFAISTLEKLVRLEIEIANFEAAERKELAAVA